MIFNLLKLLAISTVWTLKNNPEMWSNIDPQLQHWQTILSGNVGNDHLLQHFVKSFCLKRFRLTIFNDFTPTVQVLLTSSNFNLNFVYLGAAGKAQFSRKYHPLLDYIIFLTDGRPTTGVRNPETILRNVAINNVERYVQYNDFINTKQVIQ